MVTQDTEHVPSPPTLGANVHPTPASSPTHFVAYNCIYVYRQCNN